MLSEEYMETVYYKFKISSKWNFFNVGFIARVARHNKEEENNSETEVKDLNQTFLMSTMKAKI